MANIHNTRKTIIFIAAAVSVICVILYMIDKSWRERLENEALVEAKRTCAISDQKRTDACFKKYGLEKSTNAKKYETSEAYKKAEECSARQKEMFSDCVEVVMDSYYMD